MTRTLNIIADRKRESTLCSPVNSRMRPVRAMEQHFKKEVENVPDYSNANLQIERKMQREKNSIKMMGQSD